MSMCDDDESGQLDLAEFEKFFKVVLRDVAKRAAKMDSQKDLAAQMVPEDPDKLQRLHLACLSPAMQLAGNERCFDCDEGLLERWSSLTYGVLLCPLCAGEHPGASPGLKWLLTSRPCQPAWLL